MGWGCAGCGVASGVDGVDGAGGAVCAQTAVGLIPNNTVEARYRGSSRTIVRTILVVEMKLGKSIVLLLE
jgi:hypothetical protein